MGEFIKYPTGRPPPTPPIQCWKGKADSPRPRFEHFFLNIERGVWGGEPRKLRRPINAAARKTGTQTKYQTFCAGFRTFLQIAIPMKIIEGLETIHPHLTATAILFLPGKCRVLNELSHTGDQKATLNQAF